MDQTVFCAPQNQQETNRKSLNLNNFPLCTFSIHKVHESAALTKHKPDTQLLPLRWDLATLSSDALVIERTREDKGYQGH